MASRRSTSVSSFDSCGSGSSNASVGSFDVIDDFDDHTSEQAQQQKPQQTPASAAAKPSRAAETSVLMAALLKFQTQQQQQQQQQKARNPSDDVTTFSTPTADRFTPISARGPRDNDKGFGDAEAAAATFLHEHPLGTHSELLEHFERLSDSADASSADDSNEDDTTPAAAVAAASEVANAQPAVATGETEPTSQRTAEDTGANEENDEADGEPNEDSELAVLLDRYTEWVHAADDDADEPTCFGDDDVENCKRGAGQSATELQRATEKDKAKVRQTSFLCKWVGLKHPTWELEDDLLDWGFGEWVDDYNKRFPLLPSSARRRPAESRTQYLERGLTDAAKEVGSDFSRHPVDFDALFPNMADFLVEEMSGCGLQPVRFARVDRHHLNGNFAWEWRSSIDKGERVAPVRLFHGTRRENISSILRRGLLVPGQGNRIRHRAEPRYGNGIYASYDPQFADCFCNTLGTADETKFMFVCAGLARDQMTVFAEGHIAVFSRSTLILPVYLVEYVKMDSKRDCNRPERVPLRSMLMRELTRQNAARTPEGAFPDFAPSVPGKLFATYWKTYWQSYAPSKITSQIESQPQPQKGTRPGVKNTNPDGSWAPAPRMGSVQVGGEDGVRVKAAYVFTGVTKRSLRQLPKAIRDAYRDGEVKHAQRSRPKKPFQRRPRD